MLRALLEMVIGFMKDHVRCRISPSEIAAAIETLAARISADFAQQDLMVIGVLTGSIVFVADLMRKIALPHEVSMIHASSYRETATSPGDLLINLDSVPDIAGKDVLLVDDIFDSGRTVAAIMSRLMEMHPHSIRSAVLLWKTTRRTVNIVPDYFCFEIPDEFVVGYGLDYNNQYRHLPYIGVVEQPEDATRANARQQT